MADIKISALAALGGAPATGDLLVMVDISDTSMAPSGTDKNMTIANLFTSPTFTGTTATATVTTSVKLTITSAQAAAFAVGLAGATNPVFLVDSSTASQATGIKVTGAAAAGGVAVAVISSGTDEALTIDGKGAGTVGIGTISTGAITLGKSSGTNGVVIEGTGYGAGVASLRLNGLTDAAAAGAGTLTNAPVVGNPAMFVPINIGGVVFAFPVWALA